ncbi:FMN reductase [Phycicoccus sp. SLBN-51]|jgi:FMN reductase|uniref:FMN reductase n=1 Tax=Phycicoccus sp. SLBN-51 TaxID=2768447 RepID=UPI0011534B0E|nr:FMN reductase [Phycicoccus sp. SLBN-51]TQJ50720.1 FMN reductase [Phycicoccus sp. SLBN-51]
MTRRIVVVSAGLGQPSSTRLLGDLLATATTDALLEGGMEAQVEVVELRELAHDLTNTLLAGFPTGGVARALETLAGADAVVAVTPVYQGSYSGLFKTFFDVVERDVLRGTPVLLAATGGTARHSLVLEYALRPLFTHLGAVTVGTGVFAASEDWGSAGEAEQGLTARVRRAGTELAALAGARVSSGPRDPFADPVPFEELLSGM